MSFSTYKKRLVADIRGGDYSHPGSKEIITIIMDGVYPSRDNRILDVGSGLGGTTEVLTQYGQVVGVDNDTDVLKYAKEKYASLNFIEADAHSLHTAFPENSFNIVTLLSSFYSFKHPESVCQSLAKVCKPKSKLKLLDYTSQLPESKNPFHNNNLFKPINKENIQNTLGKWKIESIRDVSKDFENEYQYIIDRLHKEEQRLVKKFGRSAYNKVLSSYLIIHSTLVSGDLGGAIIFASLEK
ncbi:MAG: class I SAM-dependent methyltransferase [Endozoicomonas sp.]